jgi:hypothetical protein
MLRPLGVAAVAGVCTIGLVATPAYAGKKHGPAEYKPVRANAAGTYTFTEQKAYDTGGSETVTYTVDFSGRGGKLYLGAGDAYGWQKAPSGTVRINYTVTGNIPAVSWNPCTAIDWHGSGTLTADVKIGIGGPKRDFRKLGKGRKIKLEDKTVLVAAEGYVPVTKTTNRQDDFGGCHTETETESSSPYVEARMEGKVKGSKVTLRAVTPDDPGVDNITLTATGSGKVMFSRNPALRW